MKLLQKTWPVALGIMLMGCATTKETAAPAAPAVAQTQPAAAPAEAVKGKPEGEMCKDGPMRDGMMGQLNLTPEQKTKADAMHKTMYETMAKNREEMKKLRTQYMAAFASTAKDKEVKAIQAKMDKLHASMMTMKSNHMMQMRALLTPEQRKKFAEVHDGKGPACEMCKDMDHGSEHGAGHGSEHGAGHGMMDHGKGHDSHGAGEHPAPSAAPSEKPQAK